jgi:hypothetical protein
MRRAVLLALLFLVPGCASAQAPPDFGFRLVNRGSQAVVEVNASPSSDQRWGHNRLGSETVRAGETRQIRLPFEGECEHDLRLVFADGRAFRNRRVDLCRNPTITVSGTVSGGPGSPPADSADATPPPGAAGDNPSFNIVNQTSQRILRVFASPANFAAWGPDHLGGKGAVGPGAVFALRLPLGECRYDVRMVFEGGQVREWRNLDACRTVNLVPR